MHPVNLKTNPMMTHIESVMDGLYEWGRTRRLHHGTVVSIGSRCNLNPDRIPRTMGCDFITHRLRKCLNPWLIRRINVPEGLVAPRDATGVPRDATGVPSDPVATSKIELPLIGTHLATDVPQRRPNRRLGGGETRKKYLPHRSRGIRQVLSYPTHRRVVYGHWTRDRRDGAHRLRSPPARQRCQDTPFLGRRRSRTRIRRCPRRQYLEATPAQAQMEKDTDPHRRRD